MDCATEKILEEFQARKLRNGGYSLRAFAKSLQLSPGALSEIMSGKRFLTRKSRERLAERLNLSPSEKSLFIAGKGKSDQAFHELSEDQFNVIADPVHLHLLALMDTEGFQSDVAWIASRLGRTTTEVRSIIQRLLSVGLIGDDDSSGLYRRTKSTKTTDGVPSSALRLSHKQSLRAAAESLDSLTADDRDITSMTIATSPEKLCEAKQRIKEFRRELATFLMSGELTQVFDLNIQLYPVTSPSQSHESQRADRQDLL